MLRPHFPLNALRAFEASARHLNFTRAAIELCVTQAAVSHQVKGLERQLGVTLFKRLPRGLLLTSEGESLQPVLTECFDRIALTLGQFQGGHYREVLTVGAVGTFAVGWLLPRLAGFQACHPFIDLRLSTHNNRVDLAAEGLDYAIRFGNGAWHGTEAVPLMTAPLSVLCLPGLADQLEHPQDLLQHTLLRSYRSDEWPEWFRAAGVEPGGRPLRSIVFDSSLGMMDAALQGMGVALAPASMFSRLLASDQIRQPFAVEIDTGRYWLTRLHSRAESSAMALFSAWLQEAVS